MSARWLGWCRLPLLLAFALVTYEAARLPLAARSTEPAQDLLTELVPPRAAPPVPFQEDLPAVAPELFPLEVDQPELVAELQEDIPDAAILDVGNDGDSAQPPADFLGPGEENRPFPEETSKIGGQTMGLLNDSGNRLVVDLLQTLAAGPTHLADDADVVGPVDDLPFAGEVGNPQGAPLATDPPASRIVANALPPAGEVAPVPVLVNPSSHELAYLVNGQLYRLGPGERHQLGTAKRWVIQFDRGGDFGEATYEVSAGTHVFQVGERGWELRP